jgi:hypothetical protein
VPVNLDGLEAKALAATPGPWSTDHDRVCDGRCGDPVRYHDGSCCDHRNPVGCYIERHPNCGAIAWDAERDAAYIAAVSPDVVLKLIAVARAAVRYCGPSGEDVAARRAAEVGLMPHPLDDLTDEERKHAADELYDAVEELTNHPDVVARFATKRSYVEEPK